MKHAVSVGIVFAVFQLFIGIVSAVTVFPVLNPDFSLTEVSDSSDESLYKRTIFTSSSETRNIIWSEYNARQKAGITATGAGSVIVTGTNGSFAMQLAGIGHIDAVQPVLPGTNMANGNRLDIVRNGYTEWYISRDEGIEQGITLPTRPEGTGRLHVTYTLSGDLQTVLNGQTLLFFDRYGPVMQYGGLAAQDATGRVLPSELMLYGNQLSWHVDDRDAVYPVTIDPCIATQTAILSASDKVGGAFFGASVSIYNDTAVVGAKGAYSYSGRAYIFKDLEGIWSQTAILNASDKHNLNYFGQSISLYNNTVVVGADGAGSGLEYHTDAAGAAYVFKNTEDRWSQSVILNASDKAAGAHFGTSVSIYNDTALIGAKGATSGGYSTAGQAYVFKNSGGTWSQVAILNASDKAASAGFGNSVSLYNDTIVVGADGAPSGGYSAAGQAYVFKNSGGTWSQSAILNASDKAASAGFGNSVSLYKDTVVVGADGAPSGGYSTAGQAYVFKNSGGTWSQVAILNASDKVASAHFGTSVSIYNDTAVIGSYGVTTGEYSSAGQVYVFKNSKGTWSQVAILNASDKMGGAFFGDSISIYNDTAVIGAYGATSGGYSTAGQAYVITLAEYPAPAITGISPSSGPLAGGTLVTITGTGFTGATAVTFGSTAGTITGTITDTSINATSPAGTGTVDITVIAPGGTSDTGLSDQFTYTAAPTVTDITPSTGVNTSTTAVTITGTGFDTITPPIVNLTRTGYSTVTLTGVSGTSTTLNRTVPGGVRVGTWNVTVINPDGQESGNLTTFTVTAPIPAPTVTDISPGSGVNTGSVTVSITGTNFNTTETGSTTVNLIRFGNMNISVTGLTPASTTIIPDVLLPITGAAVGTWNVTVINPDGQESGNLTTFTVTPAPTPTPTPTATQTPAAAPIVTSIDPSGAINTSARLVTVTGTGFNPTIDPTVNLTRTGYSTIMLNVYGTSSTSTSLKRTVPRGIIAGAWNVTVTNPNGQGSGDLTQFTVTAPIPAPTVTDISPGSGVNTGSVTVSITGTSFNTTETGSTTVNLTRAGNKNISVTGLTPASTTSMPDVSLPITGAIVGIWNVTVINPDGQESGNLTTFTVTAPIPAPTVTDISPGSGVNTGSVTVSITGTHFQTTGSTTVNLTRVGNNNISVTGLTPASTTSIPDVSLPITGTAVGIWNVTVINPDGQESGNLTTFTVTAPIPAPTVTDISPRFGVNTGSVTVSITGTYFQTTGSTTINLTRAGNKNISVTGLTPASTTSIPDVSLPITGTAVGTWNVTIINPDGQEGSNSSVTFTITPPSRGPTVTGITPSSGANTGTVSITNLVGTNFAPGATVKLNRTGSSDILGSSATVVSPTNITCMFDLIDATPGKYNVVVTNTDNQAGMLENGFTVTGTTPTLPPTPTFTPTPLPTITTSGSDSEDSTSFSGSVAAVATAPGAPTGHAMTFSFSHPSDELDTLQIMQVQVLPSRTVGEMSLMVKTVTLGESNQIKGRPAVAGYRQIEPIGGNPSMFSSGNITFRVTSSWLTANHVTPGQLVMLRNYDGTWTELSTTYLCQNGNYYYFTATTPGFAYFAVVVRNTPAVTPAEPQTPISVITSVSTKATTTDITPEPTRVLTTARTLTPATSETTIAPAAASAPAGSAGFPLGMAIGTVAIVFAVVGSGLVRRWWIRHQNPVLFRKYN
ncbi:IPT/TIG domain-containing protein [Methanoregula sp.]|uniref:IPT/TIG domain-containing protein n=1 Tax=Methanoregula sp. TaxID=2052170 RepID=UPI003561A274